MSDDIEQLKELARIKTEEAAQPPEINSYIVTGTVSMIGWVMVEAESEEDALEQAEDIAASGWEVDHGTAEVVMNVTPAVERA